MTLTDQVVKNIIKRLIKSQDYRIEIVALINAEFLQFAIDFFKKVIEAKFANNDINIDWYKNTFLNKSLPPDDIAINSGLNKKTISNMYNSTSKDIVIEASNEHYDVLYNSISNLIESQPDIDLKLTIKFNGVSVELNINESLIVINTLAVKRAALRGGGWSTAGKRVEKYLMATLCKIHNVPSVHYDQQTKIPKSEREVDFYLIKNENYYLCEVKLMGRGNPESSDVIFARGSHLLVADKLSDKNKSHFEKSKVKWVELRSENGYKKFGTILKEFKIQNELMEGNLDDNLDIILNELIDK